MVKASPTHGQGQKEEGCVYFVLSTFAALYSAGPDHETASTTRVSASPLSLIDMATTQPGQVNASFSLPRWLCIMSSWQLNCYFMSKLGFCCCNKTPTKASWKGKALFQIILHHQEKAGQEPKSRNWSRAMEESCELACLPWLLGYFPHTPPDHLTRDGTVHNGLGLLHQSVIKKIPSRYGHRYGDMLLQSRFLLPRCIKMTTKIGHHTLGEGIQWIHFQVRNEEHVVQIVPWIQGGCKYLESILNTPCQSLHSGQAWRREKLVPTGQTGSYLHLCSGLAARCLNSLFVCSSVLSFPGVLPSWERLAD